jgi:hypothetical protein
MLMSYCRIEKEELIAKTKFKISDGIFPFLNKLDKIVSDHGGKIYIAKDARLSASEFKKQYPQFDKPAKFSSFLTERYFNAK